MKILYVITIGSTMGFFPKHIKMLESYIRDSFESEYIGG